MDDADWDAICAEQDEAVVERFRGTGGDDMERPTWCPHSDCEFACHSQEAVCVGRLPAPEDHDGVANTHRLCLHGAKDDGEWVFDLKVNKGDVWNMTRILKFVGSCPARCSSRDGTSSSGLPARTFGNATC